MPKITINAGQEKPVKTSGKYLSIVNSTGSFAIESPMFGSVLGELGRQLELDNVREVMFVNTRNEPVNIEYEVANIKVHISGKGGAVSIDNLPAVQEVRFSDAFKQSVAVTNLPDTQQVSIKKGQSLSVDNFPAGFSVSNLPAVQKVTFDADQSISIDNLPSEFDVSNFPTEFGVSNFPSEFGVKSGGGYQPLAPAKFTSSNTVNLANNTERLTLVIMASEDNTGLIWVGGNEVGIPLSAGREFNLGSGAAVTLYAQNTTDICYLAEVTK